MPREFPPVPLLAQVALRPLGHLALTFLPSEIAIEQAELMIELEAVCTLESQAAACTLEFPPLDFEHPNSVFSHFRERQFRLRWALASLLVEALLEDRSNL